MGNIWLVRMLGPKYGFEDLSMISDKDFLTRIRDEKINVIIDSIWHLLSLWDRVVSVGMDAESFVFTIQYKNKQYIIGM